LFDLDRINNRGQFGEEFEFVKFLPFIGNVDEDIRRQGGASPTSGSGVGFGFDCACANSYIR
jgi:hypothetical protein